MCLTQESFLVYGISFGTWVSSYLHYLETRVSAWLSSFWIFTMIPRDGFPYLLTTPKPPLLRDGAHTTRISQPKHHNTQHTTRQGHNLVPCERISGCHSYLWRHTKKRSVIGVRRNRQTGHGYEQRDGRDNGNLFNSEQGKIVMAWPRALFLSLQGCLGLGERGTSAGRTMSFCSLITTLLFPSLLGFPFFMVARASALLFGGGFFFSCLSILSFLCIVTGLAKMEEIPPFP